MSFIQQIYIANSTVLDLRYLLNPNVPFVWAVDYIPIEVKAWHASTVQINDKDVLENVEVRANKFDLLLETSKFLKSLEMFSNGGITLIQMNRKVANTLESKSWPAIPNYLFANGFYSQFYLPHKNEVSQFQCIDEQWIATACENENIKPRLL